MLELSAKLRSETGRKNKGLRKKGFIPAVIYGAGVKNLNLLVSAGDFEKVYKKAGESTLIKLNIQDGAQKKGRMVLIHDTARNPVKDTVIHIDFQQVRMDKKITAEVPLVFVGKSPAVEQENGVLIKSMQSIEAEAFPQDLPYEIEADISILKTFEDYLKVKDLKVPDKVTVLAEEEEVVASVTPPRSEEELQALEEAPVEEVEDVEVEERGKEAEETAGVEEPAKEEPAQSEAESK